MKIPVASLISLGEELQKKSAKQEICSTQYIVQRAMITFWRKSSIVRACISNEARGGGHVPKPKTKACPPSLQASLILKINIPLFLTFLSESESFKKKIQKSFISFHLIQHQPHPQINLRLRTF